MSKLKDIPFGSEIPTFDNYGYITLSSGLKDSSGNAVIETYSDRLAVFFGEACNACCACCAADAGFAGDALYLSYCNSHLSPSYCASLSAYLLV